MCSKLFFISMQITYSFANFPSNWRFNHCLICFRSFYIIFVLAEFFYMPRWFISILLHLHFCKLPFIWRISQETKIAFNFSDACLFGHPFYFDYQGFISLASDFSLQHFNVKKLWQKKLNLLANVSISRDSIMLFVMSSCLLVMSSRRLWCCLVYLSCHVSGISY